MPTATLKKVTEELGITLDDIVEYNKQGNKGIIKIEIKEKNIEKTISSTNKYSIFDLGKNPVSTGISDGSINHDKYITEHNK